MKVTKRKARGEDRWVVSLDGRAVGEVCLQNTAEGLMLPYSPCLYTDKRCEDGDRVLRVLCSQSTLEGAVTALAIAGGKAAEAAVNDRITFMGVGMTQEKAEEFASRVIRLVEEFGTFPPASAGGSPVRRNQTRLKPQ